MKPLSPSLPLYNHLSPLSHHQLSMPISSFPYFPIPISHKMTCHSSRTDTAQSIPLSVDPNRPQNGNNLYCYVKLHTPSFSDLQICSPIEKNQPKSITAVDLADPEDGDGDMWLRMRQEASLDVQQEPILSNYYFSSILCHNSLVGALSNHLSIKLGNRSLSIETLYDLFMSVIDREIILAVECDLRAVKERDPACISYIHCFLNFKGFLACQAHRIAHKLWSQGRKTLALLIQNRVSEVFAVDIHPGAKIGRGILLDHATGVVVGETAIIGDDVSILHNVTLGGTGKECGVRHPDIGNGVLIGAGTCVLGNVKIGEGAKIGAGSVVLKAVPPRTTAVGNPARLIGGKENPIRLDEIPSLTMDHTSDICEWSDYVI